MDSHRGAVSLVLAGLIACIGAACADDGSSTATGGTIQDTSSTATGGTIQVSSSTTAAGDTTPGDPDATDPADTTAPVITPERTRPITSAPVDTGPPQGSTDTVYEQGDIDPGLQPFITMAIDDLAARLDVDPAEITPLSGVLVVWSDSALGCPQPGMQYAQVPVDGSVIELGAGGRAYRYHTGGSTTPFLCDQPLTQKPPSGD